MFDYFAVLVSVILGLALTHVLRGLAKILQLRRRCRIYGPHLLWSVNVVLWVLTTWWGMFWWKNLSDWTFTWFLFIAVYAIAFFIWSYMLYPPEVRENLDFELFFFENRQVFFALLIIISLLDIPEMLTKGYLGLRPVPTLYPIVVGVVILIGIIGFFSSNRRLHWGLPIVFLINCVGFEFWSAIGHIGSAH